eukprot:3001972-Pyramimonas_sp.AAC.1
MPHGAKLAELLLIIATGGCWTGQRKFDHGLCSSPLCPRCKEAPETMLHTEVGYVGPIMVPRHTARRATSFRKLWPKPELFPHFGFEASSQQIVLACHRLLS